MDGYLTEIARLPILSTDQELCLARKAEAGNQAACDQLVRGCLRLVVSIAHRYKSGAPFADLVQAGNLALVEAVKAFDWRRGYRLATFATWRIRKAMLNTIEAEALVHLPHNVHWRIRKLREAADLFFVENGRPPTVNELAKLMEISPAEIMVARRAVRLINEIISVDVKETKGEDLFRGSFQSEEGPFIRSRNLARLLDKLDPGEKMVIELLYGLNGHQVFSQREAAERMGIHPQAVRKLHRSVIAKLRESLGSVVP